MQTKLEQLQTYLSNYAPNGICVAFSGGVDSSLVLKVAAQTVPKVAAVYFQTTLHPVGNQNTAENIAQEIGVPFYVIELDEFTNPNIMKNPLDRCYQCKHMLFSILKVQFSMVTPHAWMEPIWMIYTSIVPASALCES